MTYNVPVLIRSLSGRNLLSIGVYPTRYGWAAWVYLGRRRFVLERWHLAEAAYRRRPRLRFYQERPIVSA